MLGYTNRQAMPSKKGQKTAVQGNGTDVIIISSFSMPEKLFKEWKNRLPKHGDRSKVLQALIQKFLKGETQVIIETPPRQI